MTKYYNETSFSGSGLPPKKRRGLKRGIALACGITGSLILLFFICLWGVTLYLTPQRIEKIITEKSAEFIKGDIKTGNIGYRLFRSWPWLCVEIDSVEIISDGLKNLPSEKQILLPHEGKQLFFVEKLKCRLNVHELLHNELEIKDIEVVKPVVNIVIANDSVNNFDIFPHEKPDFKIKKIEIGEVKVVSPVNIFFCNLPDTTEIKLTVNSFDLADKKAEQSLAAGKLPKMAEVSFEGDLQGRYGSYVLPDQIPVSFKVTAGLHLPKISLDLTDFEIGMPYIRVLGDGKMNYSPTAVDIEYFKIGIGIADIFKAMEILPESIKEKVRIPAGLSGELPLNLVLNLLRPYKFEPDAETKPEIGSLPPLKAAITIPEGFIGYAPGKTEPLHINDISLNVLCQFDPASPDSSFVNVREIRLNGEGLRIDGSAEILDLTGLRQSVSADLKFSCRLMETLSYLLPVGNIKISGNVDGNLKYSGIFENLGKTGVTGSDFKGNLKSGNISVSKGSAGTVFMKNLDFDFAGKVPQISSQDFSGDELTLKLSLGNVSAVSKGNRLSMGGVSLNMDLGEDVTGKSSPGGMIDFGADKLNITDGATSLVADKLIVAMKGHINPTGKTAPANPVNTTLTGEEALIEKRIKHTPLFLVNSGGGLLQSLMSLAVLNVDVNVGDGKFTTPGYLEEIGFQGIGFSTDLNDITINAGNVAIGNTSFSLGADLKGFAGFITSSNPTLLKGDIDISFENVDINRLSAGYYGALLRKGLQQDSVYYIPPYKPYTASDSTCVAIPRNIEANIRLRSRRAEYMQYEFSPLSADIIMKDGAATIQGLTIGAPYATVKLDWTYSTSSLSDIFMSLNFDMKDFRFLPFYNVFPSIVAKHGEIRNLSGDISAIAECRFDMFPSMFLNPASLQAKFDIKGRDLQFAREGKIERLTHLMLIEGKEPIRLSDLNVSGSFHDGLLELYPFKLRFDDYQIGIAGINNLQGSMYYHIALEKSPFHLPFGVNLIGKFDHPEVRFGGTGLDENYEKNIAADPSSDLDVNIMAYLKRGWLMFAQEAAKYCLKPEE